MDHKRIYHATDLTIYQRNLYWSLLSCRKDCTFVGGNLTGHTKHRLGSQSITCFFRAVSFYEWTWERIESVRIWWLYNCLFLHLIKQEVPWKLLILSSLICHWPLWLAMLWVPQSIQFTGTFEMWRFMELHWSSLSWCSQQHYKSIDLPGAFIMSNR